MDTEKERNVRKQRLLGDWVALLAEPIKRVLQRFGWWNECGCERRRARLNAWHRRVLKDF